MGSEKQHIVIIGPAYPLRGGLATYNELLATKLQTAGHQVKILTFSLQYPSLLFPGKTQYSSEPEPEHLTIELALNSINPINWIRIGRQLAREAPDLIIFRYWMPFMAPCLGTVGRIARRNRKTRVVAITDNIIPHERRPFDQSFTRYFMGACNGFVAMSKAVQSQLKEWAGNTPALFNPHPMYESFGEAINQAEALKELGLPDDKKYLLFFGFIRKYKGLDLLLKAFSMVDDPNMKLIIAGEYYEDPAPYQSLIESLNMGDRIIQVNEFIPDSSVRYYFCAADLVVQTYLSATQSGVTQVAYYYTTPMIVTDVGGLAELVPDGQVGYVCPVDEQAIADSITRYFKEEMKGPFQKKMQEEKKRFTWDSMINKLFEAAG